MMFNDTRRTSPWVVIVVFFILLIGFLRSYQRQLVKHTFILMDTYVDLVLERRSEKMLADLLERAKILEREVSFYEKDSCVARLNKGGEIKKSDGCFDVLAELIELSQKICRQSKGAFDPGYLSDVSICDVVLSGDKIVVPKKGVFDFSGIAKGYIVDKLIEFARKEGVRFVMINAGGDVRVWDEKKVGVVIEIKNPFGGVLDKIRIYDGAIATSGTYERGRHIVDPKTKRKVSGLVSASARAKTCAIADGWATALFILGKNGLSLAEKAGVGAMIAEVGSAGKIIEFENKNWHKYGEVDLRN